jgi:16S rRNA (guanine966-N2)-methyltransferase
MTGVRITGGSLRGRRATLPAGTDVRPTSDKARQAFFNIVGPQIVGARFLDLFSGTGIFSLEAVSRGASEAVASDLSRKAADAIRAIATQWELPIKVLSEDAIKTVGRAWGEPFDVVYADPPYAYENYAELLAALDSSATLADGAVVAIEHRSGTVPFDPASVVRLRFRRTARYGNVSISIFDAGTDAQ